MSNWEKFAVSVGVPLAIALLAVIVGIQWSNGYQLGRQSEAIINLESRTDDLSRKITTEAQQTRKHVDTTIMTLGSHIKSVEDAMVASGLDMGQMLVEMGVVLKSDQFKAVVWDGGIWVIATGDARQRLEDRGLESGVIGGVVSGYKVMPVSAAVQKRFLMRSPTFQQDNQ